ncbi:hypothetical protein SAMN04488513_102186 [Pseudozobellia thermophila]|uniref:Adhesin n=2 Tax=Pseudozobellia thermophila TaxID=192903 RepID=A0A1M6EUQ2_9FLAO|nr:hypothetical protein SAMN04488513_102186 [Pseudozobellia thermophila]
MGTHCRRLFLVIVALGLSLPLMAQEKRSKKLAKSYRLTNAGELHLDNKYGNVNIYGWDKEELSLTVTITVTHKKKDNAQELLDRIRPVLRNSDNFVSLSYEIGESSSGFFSQLFEKANPFDFDRSNIQIDYEVFLPEKAELELANKFGDVFIEDWNGALQAQVQHGDIWISENLNKADISLEFGELRAKNISYGNLELKNGGVDMHDSKNLRINSSGSDIEIGQVTSLEFYSNKDEVTIDEAGSIYGSLKFTSLRLNRLGLDVDMGMKIADFRIDRITNAKTTITIDQESSEISINISDFPHKFSAILEEGLVRLPKSFQNVNSELLDKGKKRREIKATYGKQGQGKISITGKKGLVLLKEL